MAVHIAVTGGKGGVGKTMIAINVAMTFALNNYSVLLVDADVDNPNAHINLGIEIHKISDITIFTPEINIDKCVLCGECAKNCPENAIIFASGKLPIVFDEECSGCKVCKLVCKYNAISSKNRLLGHIFAGSYINLDLVGAELKPGEAKSPIAAKTLINYVENIDDKYEIIVIDTSPGVQNTVMQSIKIADLALLVTEPTPLGLHTLVLSNNALNKLKIPKILVINKSNISDKVKTKIYEYANRNGIDIAIEIPYSKDLLESSIKGIPIVTTNKDPSITKAFEKLIKYIMYIIKGLMA